MSVLAHLAGCMGEPGATQALAYLLNRQAGLLREFVNLPGAAGIQFDPRPRVESEMGGDGGRPDMRIYDMNGNLRVLVENKFWAALTGAQPVDYLDMLPNDESSGLLFIVPRQRVNMIWNALQARCQDAGLNLGQGLLGGEPGEMGARRSPENDVGYRLGKHPRLIGRSCRWAGSPERPLPVSTVDRDIRC